MMFNEYGDILSLEDLCEVLKVSENTAYRLIKEGKVKAFKVGRIYKIPKIAVETYILDESQI